MSIDIKVAQLSLHINYFFRSIWFIKRFKEETKKRVFVNILRSNFHETKQLGRLGEKLLDKHVNNNTSNIACSKSRLVVFFLPSDSAATALHDLSVLGLAGRLGHAGEPGAKFNCSSICSIDLPIDVFT